MHHRLYPSWNPQELQALTKNSERHRAVAKTGGDELNTDRPIDTDFLQIAASSETEADDRAPAPVPMASLKIPAPRVVEVPQANANATGIVELRARDSEIHGDSDAKGSTTKSASAAGAGLTRALAAAAHQQSQTAVAVAEQHAESIDKVDAAAQAREEGLAALEARKQHAREHAEQVEREKTEAAAKAKAYANSREGMMARREKVVESLMRSKEKEFLAKKHPERLVRQGRVAALEAATAKPKHGSSRSKPSAAAGSHRYGSHLKPVPEPQPEDFDLTTVKGQQEFQGARDGFREYVEAAAAMELKLQAAERTRKRSENFYSLLANNDQHAVAGSDRGVDLNVKGQDGQFSSTIGGDGFGAGGSVYMRTKRLDDPQAENLNYVWYKKKFKPGTHVLPTNGAVYFLMHPYVGLY